MAGVYHRATVTSCAGKRLCYSCPDYDTETFAATANGFRRLVTLPAALSVSTEFALIPPVYLIWGMTALQGRDMLF